MSTRAFSSLFSSLCQNRKDLPAGILTLVAFLMLAVSLHAQERGSRLRIVFEFSSGDADSIRELAANVDSLQKHAGKIADITVVAFGNGVTLFHSGNEEAEQLLADLADNGVDFAVCRDSLDEAEIDRNEILSFARTVKLGTKEIEQLEELGWARIPEGESYVTHL